MSVTNPLNGKSRYTYNSQGSLITQTHPNGASTKYHYDREGKITQKSNALGNSSYLIYDTQQRVKASVNANRVSTEYFYDATDRIIQTKDGIHNTLEYQYNNQARLYSISDPVKNETKYFYDKAGRVTGELGPDRRLSLREYNKDNTLKRIIRSDESHITFQYNALRLPSEIVYEKESSGKSPTTQHAKEHIKQSFSYDSVGRLIEANNHDSSVSLEYNRVGKISKEQQFFNQFTITKTSDAKSYTDRLTFLHKTITIQNDVKTKTKTITSNNRYPITIHYDTQGIEHTISYPNGQKEKYSFNPANQIISIETANQRLSYQYDKVGNITQKGQSYYEYDAIGRLIGANQTDFKYDKAGNNQNHQSIYDTKTNQLLANEHYLFTYDARGNIQSKTNKQTKQITYYHFNLINQLTEVIIKDRNQHTIKTLTYEYDALNRRVMKQEDNQIYYYLYDGLNIIAILDKHKQAIATITHHDTKIDTPLSIHTIYGVFYYHRDHQGSIIALSDEYGDIVETIQYDDHYGTITKHWQREDIETYNPFGYTGRETDHSDLYYYRARYYDPTTQRFLSLDPIGFLAGDFNFYRYVGNSPVVWKDPLGWKGEQEGSIFDTIGNTLSEVGSSIGYISVSGGSP